MSMDIETYRERFVFVITPYVAAAINMKAAGKTCRFNELPEEEQVDYMDITAASDALNNISGFRSPEFVGTAMHLMPDGEIEDNQERDISYDGNSPFPFAGIFCEKDPFFHPFSPTYANYGEVIEEIQSKLGDLLPDWCKIEDDMYAVVGTITV